MSRFCAESLQPDLNEVLRQAQDKFRRIKLPKLV
ncbi:hypothetical protein DRF69_03990 [Chryseobacterium sp. 5_R23647]|nr:hypothetical protein DRF69_03990 [Chryseobacterium sp. 5_R23647]